MARLRGLALITLGVISPALFALEVLAILFGLMAVVERGRALPRLARRLSGQWCGVEVPDPYQAPPPPPEQRPDGMYAYRHRLFSSPRHPKRRLRVRWLMSDTATWHDLFWMVANPLIGTALGLLAAVLGEPALRLHGIWTRALLGEGRPWPIWVRDRTVILVNGWRLFLLSLIELPLLALHLAVLTGACLGATPPLVIVIENSRGFTNMYRRLSGDIDVPYLPEPPHPQPEADGRYRRGLRLYRAPGIPTHLGRLAWVTRDPATARDMLWMLVNPLVTAVLLGLPATVGVVAITRLSSPWLWWPLAGPLFGYQPPHPIFLAPLGVLIAIGVLAAAPALRKLHDVWAKVLLAPTKSALLAQRVRRLTETRADAVDTQAAELRRIERDLHDGTQGRLVAMGMALRTVERLLDDNPEMARKLVVEVRENTAAALAEIRELVHGIHPPVLAERGLVDALHLVALDTPLEVEVDARLPGRPDAPVESAAYFAVRELITNAAKHAEASKVTISVRHGCSTLKIAVTDDGHGGADPRRGSGLRGVQRRLGTFDGLLDISSPPGGPTTVTMEIPCVLSSPRTSTC